MKTANVYRVQKRQLVKRPPEPDYARQAEEDRANLIGMLRDEQASDFARNLLRELEGEG